VDLPEGILRLVGLIFGWLFGWPLDAFRRWLDREPDEAVDSNYFVYTIYS